MSGGAETAPADPPGTHQCVECGAQVADPVYPREGRTPDEAPPHDERDIEIVVRDDEPCCSTDCLQSGCYERDATEVLG